MAGDAIDRLSDASASLEEQQKRKRKLIKGPLEFREMRKDQLRGKAKRWPANLMPQRRALAFRSRPVETTDGAMEEYRAKQKAEQKKTARLRELRLAKEAGKAKGKR
jgi:hypothetical protein